MTEKLKMNDKIEHLETEVENCKLSKKICKTVSNVSSTIYGISAGVSLSAFVYSAWIKFGSEFVNNPNLHMFANDLTEVGKNSLGVAIGFGIWYILSENGEKKYSKEYDFYNSQLESKMNKYRDLENQTEELYDKTKIR